MTMADICMYSYVHCIPEAPPSVPNRRPVEGITVDVVVVTVLKLMFDLSGGNTLDAVVLF